MKRFVLPILMLILSLVLFAACGGTDDDSDIVGHWTWDDGNDRSITFNADGTGVRNWWIGGQVDHFNWTISGTDLEMTMTSGVIFDEPEFRNDELWTATITGNHMLLASQQGTDTFNYTRD